MKRDFPTLIFENRYRKKGYHCVAGLDEAGRGPLAGPVVAAAAVLPRGFKNFGLKDSKLLPEKERERLFALILNSDIIFGIGIVNHKIIDKINIYQATQLAMKKAILRLVRKPDVLLVDGMKLNFTEISQERIVKGDRKVLSIAAASVVAKVTRDRIMQKFDLIYPGYGLEKHKGYPTKAHCLALKKLGITPIHRKTYGPVREIIAD